MRYFILLALVLLSFSLAAEEKTNSIIVCDNGREMLAWDLAFLSEATQSVEIGACFLGGDVAQEILQAVEQRLKQVPELQVYVLTSTVLLEPKDQKLIDRLVYQYPRNFHIIYSTSVAIVWPDVSGIDNHTKMFVVDEKYFSVGGTNLDETGCSDGTYSVARKNSKSSIVSNNLPPGMRDQDVVGCGTLAKKLRKHFYKMCALWEYYEKTGLLERDPEKFHRKNHYKELSADPYVESFETSPRKRTLAEHQVRLVFGGPHQKKNEITKEYEKLIRSAKKEIVIANLYFSPEESIFQALLDAVNRGVKLTVITNGISDISPEYTQYFCWANRMSYVPMFYGKTFHFWDAWSVAKKKVKKTHIFEYHVKDILLHKKMMLIDNQKFLLGSYNLGTRSHMSDYELVLVIHDHQVTEDAFAIHLKDLSYSREVSPKEAREWYFDPVKAYLGELQRRFHGLF